VQANAVCAKNIDATTADLVGKKMKTNFNLMIVAGEASGDVHAAELVKKIRQSAPEKQFDFFGLTGEKMRTEGVETIVPADDLAIIGLLEIAAAFPKFWRAFQTLKKAAAARKPDAVILIDFPEFNLPLAKALKKTGLKIIYYISPQLWAWRSYRVKYIKRDVDLLLTILPFEKQWYAKRGVHHVEFVGHPLVNEIKLKYQPEEFLQKHHLNKTNSIIALLPGSRRKEVTRILPPMLDTVKILREKNPSLQFAVAAAPGRKPQEILEILEKAGLPDLKIIENATKELLSVSAAAVVASGTATLETALIGTPLVIVYRVAAHNWHTLRHLINVPHYGLVNLIAEERLAAELIQHDCTGEKIATEIEKLLDDQTNKEMRQRLREVCQKLGDGGASEKAAQIILAQLKSTN
jgi:lipid-A-disaccharide synthase